MKYGCWNLPRQPLERTVKVAIYDNEGNYLGEGTERIKPVMSDLCRHIGQYFNNEWHEDKQCEGCKSGKDEEWISRMRGEYEKEVQSYRMRC